jgi:hypothetical protein
VPEVDPNAPTDPTKALRAGGGLPSAAIDPQTGELSNNAQPLNSTDVFTGTFQPSTLRSTTARSAAPVVGTTGTPRTVQRLRR